MPIQSQGIITRDNVPARVTAVAYYRVIDPTRSVIEIESVIVNLSGGRLSSRLFAAKIATQGKLPEGGMPVLGGFQLQAFGRGKRPGQLLRQGNRVASSLGSHLGDRLARRVARAQRILVEINQDRIF